MFRVLVRYLTSKLDAIHRLVMLQSLKMEKMMLSLDALKAANADLREKVTSLETATAGVVSLERQHAQQLKDLAAQLDAIKNLPPDQQQPEIDALAQSARDLAAEVDAKARETATAVTEGTDVEDEPKTETPVEPVPAAPPADAG
jgi:chromosome segregation ATPase